jgi:hypothetical protein
MLIADYNTYSEERYRLSYALRTLSFQPSVAVLDGFQRNARKMWKTRPLAGSGRERTERP